MSSSVSPSSRSSPYEALLIDIKGKLKNHTITVQDIDKIGTLPYTNQVIFATLLDSDFKEIKGDEKAAWDKRLESLFPGHNTSSVSEMVNESIDEAFIAKDERKLVSLLEASQIFDEEYLTKCIDVFAKEYSSEALNQLLLNALRSGKWEIVIKTVMDPDLRFRMSDKLKNTLFEQLYSEKNFDLIAKILNKCHEYLHLDNCPSLLTDIKSNQFDIYKNGQLISGLGDDAKKFLICKRLIAQDVEGLVYLLGLESSPPPVEDRPMIARFLLDELSLDHLVQDEKGRDVHLRSLLEDENIGPKIIGYTLFQSRATIDYKRLELVLQSDVTGENRKKIDDDLKLFRAAIKDNKFNQLENWPAVQAKRQALSYTINGGKDQDSWVTADQYLQNSELNLSSQEFRRTMCEVNQKIGNNGRFRNGDVFVDLSKMYPNPRLLHTMGLPDLFKWIDENHNKENPIIFAALFFQRFISMHPFSDGNGRTGRMLMDYILMKNGLPPPILTEEENMAAHFPDDKERKPFEVSVCEGIRRSLETLKLLPQK